MRQWCKVRFIKEESEGNVYSKHAQSEMTQVHGLPQLEYRRTEQGKPWVSLQVTPPTGRTRIKQLNSDGTTLQLTWKPLPEDGDWRHNARQHRAVLHYDPAVENDEVYRIVDCLGETFTTCGPFVQAFRHKCYDGTHKTLQASPDESAGRTPHRHVEVEVLLPARVLEGPSQYDDPSVLTKLWKGFEANENHYPKVAFELLKDLITQSDKKAISKLSHGDVQFYEYGAKSKRYFRWFYLGESELVKEYHPATKTVTNITTAGRRVQASLSRRKAQLYQNDETHSRF